MNWSKAFNCSFFPGVKLYPSVLNQEISPVEEAYENTPSVSGEATGAESEERLPASSSANGTEEQNGEDVADAGMFFCYSFVFRSILNHRSLFRIYLWIIERTKSIHPLL